jgi:CheY-like chemotaxis protein
MRILVVDNDTLNRFLLVHMLEQQGYIDTFDAEDGAVAIELAKRINPDLVLLDVVMPEMDVYEVATRLKKLAGDIYLPIIFINVVTNQLSLYGIHSELFTVLSELYNNALEHGVLELDSELKQSEEGFFEYFTQREEKLLTLDVARIVISAEYVPHENSLAIRVRDSGKGFKQGRMTKLENIEKSYGRGNSLVKELCESVEYTNKGNTVDVVFKI